MDENDLADEPIAQLEAWLAEAREAVDQPDVMALATADADGRPSARMVLLRGVDVRGVAFFTNRDSRKGRELRENPRAAAVLHWWELGRQVRVEGSVEELSEAESRAYWATRPRAARSQGGRRTSRNRSPAAASSTPASSRQRRGSPAATSPCRRSGAATASSPRASSSGSTATPDSTTGCGTSAPLAAGGGNAWRRSYRGARAPSVYRPSAFQSM